ncbi:MAG: hypothetical protein ABIN89_02270 [Chitinophagaceae bacterium]
MVDNKNAIALMGNHEYNALCFHYQETDGGHLRKHSIKNIIQHYETRKQFQNQQAEYETYIEWFKTLPLFYGTDQFRAVHACWDNKNITYLRTVLSSDRLTDDLIYQSVSKSTKLHDAVKEVLKGKEIIPDGVAFTDKDGTSRSDLRIKWWVDPVNATYKSISVEPIDGLPKIHLMPGSLKNMDYYCDEKPVFFGHYWLKGRPGLYKDTVCCLDYSVARAGFLVAYPFDGEEKLREDKLVFV